MAYKKICGIYKITSPSGRIYIGQSLNIYKRWADYRSLCNCSEQYKLYNSFLKYGVKNHIFEIICECSSLEESNTKEVYYGKLFNVTDKYTGLNIRDCGGSSGSHNAETLLKMSKSQLGKKRSEEFKKQISIRQKGRPAWNKGKSGCQVAWNKGLSMSNETKEKLSKAHSGKVLSIEQKNKISISLIGRVKTDEHLKKIGKSNKGKIVSDATRKKLSESHKGILQSEESKKKKSEALKDFYKNKKIKK